VLVLEEAEHVQVFPVAGSNPVEPVRAMLAQLLVEKGVGFELWLLGASAP